MKLKALNVRKRVMLEVGDREQVAAQEFKKDVDINTVVKRYASRAGQKQLIMEARSSLKNYGDVSQVPDFQEMLNRTIAAKEAFMVLPPEIREKYDNDPGKLLKGLQTKEGLDLAVKLGLADKVEQKGNKDVSEPIGSDSKSGGVDVDPGAGKKSKKTTTTVVEE